MRALFGLVLCSAMAVQCAQFKAIDPAKVKTLSFIDKWKAGRMDVCGLQAETLPALEATLDDGSVRTTGGHDEEKMFDADEVQWTASIGTIEKLPDTPVQTRPGTFYQSKKSNFYKWVPPANVSKLVDDDVTVTVAFKKNPNAKSTLTLVPDFRCLAILDFSGARGEFGVNGQGTNNAAQGQMAGDGGDGGPGGNGGNAGTIEGTITVVSTAKRGPLGRATFKGSNGATAVAYFSTAGKGLLVRNEGGEGGEGGGIGIGGEGDQGGHGMTLCGGNGGNGGDGGRGGDGGTAIVHVDASHPELETLVRVSVEGGAAGPGFKNVAGSAGASYYGCNRPGKDGRPGRDGSRGSPGKLTVLRDGSSGDVQFAEHTTRSAPTATANATTKSAPSSTTLENKTRTPFCTMQAGMKNGRQVVFSPPNLLSGALAPGATATMTVPDGTIVVRGISCDRKSAGVVLYKGPSALVIADLGGKEGPANTMSLVSMTELAKSPFAVK